MGKKVNKKNMQQQQQHHHQKQMIIYEQRTKLTLTKTKDTHEDKQGAADKIIM